MNMQDASYITGFHGGALDCPFFKSSFWFQHIGQQHCSAGEASACSPAAFLLHWFLTKSKVFYRAVSALALHFSCLLSIGFVYKVERLKLRLLLWRLLQLYFESMCDPADGVFYTCCRDRHCLPSHSLCASHVWKHLWLWVASCLFTSLSPSVCFWEKLPSVPPSFSSLLLPFLFSLPLQWLFFLFFS